MSINLNKTSHNSGPINIYNNHYHINININGDRIESFSYKTKSKSRFNNAGIYIFEQKILGQLPDKGSLEKDVFPMLASQGNLFAYTSSREWKNIR